MTWYFKHIQINITLNIDNQYLNWQVRYTLLRTKQLIIFFFYVYLYIVVPKSVNNNF